MSFHPYRSRRKALWLIPVCAVAALAAAAAFLFFINRFSIRVDPIGEKSVTLPWGETYTDPGADAYISGTLIMKEGVPVPVVTEGEIDPQTLGVQTLRYQAKRLFYTGSAERTVTVVDEEPPVLELTPDKEDAYTVPGEAYVEAGYRAYDAHDGDLTDTVRREEREGKVVYTVADSSGNETTAERTIRYADITPPTLTLLGDTEITLTIPNTYEEPGFTANDDRDGDLTASVKVEGSVDSAAPGTYTLTYSVSDAFGNEATAVRTVTVENPPLPKPPPVIPTPTPGSGKVVYLTFDDGPSAHTARLLDTLSAYGAKATFFVVNYGYTSLIGREAAEGHSVGVHSATHDFYQIYQSEDAFFSDFNRMRQIIFEQTGTWTTLMRFPGGSSNTISRYNPGIMTRLANAVTNMGYQYFDWNAGGIDAGGTTSAYEVYQNAISNISSSSVPIVLLHDSKSYTVDAVQWILSWGVSNGYTFLPLTPDSPTVHHPISN